MGLLLFPFPAGRIMPKSNRLLLKMLCSFWSLVNAWRVAAACHAQVQAGAAPALEALPVNAGESKNCRQLPSCCWTPARTKTTIGWLSLQKPQRATRRRRLSRKYSKFPAKEEKIALPEESAHDVALLPCMPRRNCKNPGHAVLTGTGRQHALPHPCFSKAPLYARSQENRASSRTGKLWIKAGQREPGPRKHHQQRQPSSQSPLQLVPTRSFPPSTEHRHIQLSSLLTSIRPFPRSPEKLLHPQKRSHQD